MNIQVLSRSIVVVAMAVGLSACGGGKSNAKVTVGANAAPVTSALTIEVTEDTAIETVLPAVDER